jgi:hypothetical protein
MPVGFRAPPLRSEQESSRVAVEGARIAVDLRYAIRRRSFAHPKPFGRMNEAQTRPEASLTLYSHRVWIAEISLG